ncbi:DUF3859 domain-containing protein [Vibrio sp. JPW-9-11-11]|uniref:DUF3859 domain-containing protein n=1 Tax=Vibrio sp. JPW-9-11-11 TaxID=1416532 RepID=UPI001594B6E4|nr:DUF3859 domain-containing protein [Vibrio sp. JPW-9-11-11]NVD06299.1 DUF3859 domain-containing protein [Vibrio sp. JPW-9-11-11]
MFSSKTSVLGLLSLSILLGGCASKNNEQTSVEQQSDAKVEVGATATVKESGLATPAFKNKQLVGYNFQKGFAVPAKIGNFFGLSYTATQSLKMTSDATDAKVYKSLPVVIEVTHPEINGSTNSRWNDTLYFGRDNFAMWQFESDAELVSGKWTVAVKLNDQVIAEQNFFVQVPPKMPAKVAQVCKAQVELFPQPLQEAHTACCESNDAQACYNFAWRGLERVRDKEGALLYYAKSCDLGDVSGCRTAAKFAKTEDQKLEFFNKGCDLKDFESCIDADRQF